MVDDDEYFPDIDALWEERMETGYWDPYYEPPEFYDPTEYDPNADAPDVDDWESD